MKSKVEFNHFFDAITVTELSEQGRARCDAATAVEVVSIGKPNDDVIAAHAVGEVRHHDEGDVDLLLEPGVPMFAEGFSEATARPAIDPRPTALESIRQID